MIVVYYENKEYASQIEYSFKILGNCIKQKICFIHNLKDTEQYKQKDIIKVIYGTNFVKLPNSIFIYEAGLFSKVNYLKTSSIPEVPLYRLNNLPICYTLERRMKGIERTTDQIVINADVIQSTFFLVTNYEEALCNDVNCFDQHQRYKVEEGILFKENYLDKPLINQYAELLGNLGKELCKDFMPFNLNSSFTIHITHDVDYPYETKFIDRLRSRMSEYQPDSKYLKLHQGCELIYQTEKKYSLFSSWYFKCLGRSVYDDRYDLDNPVLLEFIRKLKNGGHEIGYHYSYGAAIDIEQAKKESETLKKLLNIQELFGRNHFLRYKIPDSWRIYEKLNLIYDSTQGSASHEGFCRGICCPYKLYDVLAQKELNVWEIPLLVMDGTLRNKQYRGMGAIEARKRVIQLIEIVEQYHGVFSILWHNTSLGGRYWYRYTKKVYKPIMKYLKMSNGECIKGKDIIERYNVNG